MCVGINDMLKKRVVCKLEEPAYKKLIECLSKMQIDKGGRVDISECVIKMADSYLEDNNDRK